MTKRTSKVIKVGLLLGGYAIIFLAWVFFGNKQKEAVDYRSIYVWVNAYIVYSFIFIPLFLSNVHKDNLDRKIPSIVIVWSTVGIFDVVTIVLMILVRISIMSIKVAIIIQAIALFIECIIIFVGYLGNSHIEAVQQDEANLMNNTVQIRNALELLIIKSSTLADAHSEAKERIAKMSEEVRFMAPCDNTTAKSLEVQILTSINKISGACDAVSIGADNGILNQCISELELLIKQRKICRS